MGQATRRMKEMPISPEIAGERGMIVQRRMQEQVARPQPTRRTRRPVDEPVGMRGRRKSSLLKQRLGD